MNAAPDASSPVSESRGPERSTRQRRAIRAVFEQAERPLAIEEVLTAARGAEHGVSLATVYRSVRALTDEGWLTTVELPGLGAFYEVAGKGHHHHFSCVSCRRLFELEGCFPTTGIVLPSGFQALSHEVLISGVCAECASRKRVHDRREGPKGIASPG